MVFYSCNIATSSYTTSTIRRSFFPVTPQLKTLTAAIVYRIMQFTALIGNRGLHRICRILIESGTPYTLSSAIILVAAGFEEVKQSFAWSTVHSIAEDIVRFFFPA